MIAGVGELATVGLCCVAAYAQCAAPRRAQDHATDKRTYGSRSALRSGSRGGPRRRCGLRCVPAGREG